MSIRLCLTRLITSLASWTVASSLNPALARAFLETKTIVEDLLTERLLVVSDGVVISISWLYALIMLLEATERTLFGSKLIGKLLDIIL